MPSDEPSVADQLAALLEETDLSQRELGRRLAGTERADSPAAKSKTRWVQKILAGEVERPRPASLREIERAAGRPGYFRMISKEPSEARPTWRQRTDGRLGVLEDEAARVQDVLRLDRVLRAAIRSLATGDAAEALRVLSEAEHH